MGENGLMVYTSPRLNSGRKGRVVRFRLRKGGGERFFW